MKPLATMNNCCKKCDESFGGGTTMLPLVRKCGNLDCPCHTDTMNNCCKECAPRTTTGQCRNLYCHCGHTGTKSGWEEEFDKEFLTPAGHVRYLKNGNYYTAAKEIKAFIARTIEAAKEEARAEVIAEVEKELWSIPWDGPLTDFQLIRGVLSRLKGTN